MPLLVTGTIGIDTVETPTASVERVSGGSCAYFAVAAAFHHSPVRVVGVVGGDWPAQHEKLLRSVSGLCLDGLEKRPDSKTFAWGGRYFDNMNDRETLFTELGVLEEEPPEIPHLYQDSRMIFLANSHPSIQLDLLDKFPDRTLAVADTMDLWINIANNELHVLLQQLDGFIINDSEAELITGISDPIAAGQKILELGPSFVIVKKGEYGSVLVDKDNTAVLPAFPLAIEDVIDPTGAGDSFAGGFMGYIATVQEINFEEMRTAMAWGTVTASFTLQSFGLDGLVKASKDKIRSRMVEFTEFAK